MAQEIDPRLLSMAPDQASSSSTTMAQETDPGQWSMAPDQANSSSTTMAQEIHPDQHSMPSGQSDMSNLLPTPQTQGMHLYPVFPPTDQLDMSNLLPATLQTQGVHSNSVFTPSGQPGISSWPSESPNQEQPPTPIRMPPGQLDPLHPPSKLQAQANLAQPFSMPPDIGRGTIPSQPSSTTTQAIVPYHEQPPHTPMPELQQPPMLLFNRLAHPHHLPGDSGRVWCLRIPADGSYIQRIEVNLVMSDQSKSNPMPVIGHWWPGEDPTRRLHVRTPSTFCSLE